MVNKSSIINNILMISIIGAFLTACDKSVLSSDQMDRSTFTGNPCSAPCWHNLIIGKSTESDVISTLQTLTFIDQNTIKIHRMSMSGLVPSVYGPGAEITANCIIPHKQCLTTRVVDGVLTGVEIILNYKISLDEANNYLGDPDYINYQMMGAEDVTCEVQLIWKSKQLILASDTFKGGLIEKNCGMVHDTGKIVSSLVISKVRYVSSEAIEFYLASGSTFFKYSGTLPGK